MRFCNNCGNQLSNSAANNCNECGVPLSAKRKESPRPPEKEKAKSAHSKSFIISIVLMVVGLGIWGLGLFEFLNSRGWHSVRVEFIIGTFLYGVTLFSYFWKKSWSLIMSVANLIFLNLLSMYLVTFSSAFHVDREFIFLSLTCTLLCALFAAIFNAKALTNAKDAKDKAFWMKINASPTKQDNTLFKVGCAISALAMGASLFAPFFSVNIWEFSYRFSLVDLVEISQDSILRQYGHMSAINRMLEPLWYALILLVSYIFILLCVSISNSKAVKTTIGITMAISMVALVFGAQTIAFNAIESIIGGNAVSSQLGFINSVPRIDFGDFIMSSVSNMFTTIFRLEIGVWLLIGSLVAYITFASCQFSRFKRPGLVLGQLSQPPLIKVRCAECGGINEEDAAFCSRCGTPMTKEKPKAALHPTSECVSCGMKLTPGMKFCSKCGTSQPEEGN